MPRVPTAVKRRIMRSQAYHEWSQERRRHDPIPEDIFRAYQIDKSLEAKIRPKPEWRKEPNRTDMVHIDYPLSSVRPQRRVRPTRREPERRPYPVERREKPRPSAPKGLKKELMWRAREMTERYKVPMPKDLGFLYHGRASYYRLGMSPEGKPATGGEIGLRVKVAKPVMLASFYHELGHHVDAFLGYKKTGQLSKPYRRGVLARRVGGETQTVAMERRAWRYAKPFMREKVRQQRWASAYMLGTYTGKTKRITEI